MSCGFAESTTGNTTTTKTSKGLLANPNFANDPKITAMDTDDQPRKPRVRNRRLAADGLPSEMFQDVLRACHRTLIQKDEQYQVERIAVKRWATRHKITLKRLGGT